MFLKCTNIFFSILLSLTFFNAANAQSLITELPLDEIFMQLNAEQWVKTSTAKVTVSIDAALTKENLAVAREQIMNNLNKIAVGDWHITQFDRSQDNSGLEKLYATAEARIDEKLLSNINVQAKDISKPGANYKIQNVEFVPSLVELEKVKAAVRSEIYQKAKLEVDELNKAYPEQKYSLHKINFLETAITPGPMVRFQGADSNVMAAKAAPITLPVSNIVQITATVDIAATRDLKGKL